MKRITAMILCMLMILSTAPSAFAMGNGMTAYAEKTVDGWMVSAEYESGIALAAGYLGGETVSVKRVNNKKVFFDEKIDTIKVMNIESMESMKPLCPAVTIDVGVEIEGVVLSTFLSEYYLESYDEPKTITICVTKSSDEKEVMPGDIVKFAAPYTDDVTITDILGCSVTAFAYEGKILSIDKKEGVNTKTVIKPNNIRSVNLPKNGEDGYIQYSENHYDKDYVTCLIENIQYNNFVVNGMNSTNVYYVDRENYYFDNCEEIVLVDNDGDKNAEFLFAYEFTDKSLEFVAEEVTEYYVWGESGFGFAFDDGYTAVIKDGKAAKAQDIKKGDVITFWDVKAEARTAYVSSEKAVGVINEIDLNDYYIGDKIYHLNACSGKNISKYDLQAGAEGTYYINYRGDIVSVDIADNGEFVYILSVDKEKDSWGDVEYVVTYVTALGKTETAEIWSKAVSVFAEDSDGRHLSAERAALKVDEEIGKSGTLAKIEKRNTGEINKFILPGYRLCKKHEQYYDDEDNIKSPGYDKAAGVYGEYKLDADLPVFIPSKDDETGAVTCTVTPLKDIFEDKKRYSFVAYGRDTDTIGAIKLTGIEEEREYTAADNPVMVVTRKVYKYEDDMPAIGLTGIMAGKTVSVTVDPKIEKDMNTAESIGVGNVVIFELNGGIASDIVILLDSSNKGIGKVFEGNQSIKVTDDYNDMRNNVSVHLGEVARENTDGSFLLKNDEWSEKNMTFLPTSYANYTLVDYTGATVKIGAGSSHYIRPSTSRKSVYVFVKTAYNSPQSVTDIVIFWVSE